MVARQVESLPTRHQLDAALLVAGVLPKSPRQVEDVRAAYQHIPTEGIFDLTDLAAGETLLIAAGVAVLDGDRLSLGRDLAYINAADHAVARQLLLAELLAVAAPPWLAAATATGELRFPYLPTGVESLLEEVIPDPVVREAMLLSLGQKHESDQGRAMSGLLGEEAVVAACRELLTSTGTGLPEQVVHVSLISDALGYDVSSPAVDGSLRRIEVKTVGYARTSLQIYLTRNEFDVGLNDHGWRLVICKMTSRAEVEILGWCRGSDLLELAPQDSLVGHWAQAQLDLPDDLLHPGIPMYPDC